MPEDVFDGGPPLGLQRRFGLIKDGDRRNGRRALFVALITWFPLLVLTALEDIFCGGGSLKYILRDVGVSARFLVAAPLLVAAESWCLPRLSRIPQRFLDTGIVLLEDQPRLDAIVASTKRYMNSGWEEICGVILAYLALAELNHVLRIEDLPKWHVHAGSHAIVHTPAGLWHAWISSPILLLILLGWMWRQLLLCRLLWLVSRLNLCLIASHPDRSGGLRFLAGAIRGYWPLSFAIGAIVAGRVGNNLQLGISLYDSSVLILGVQLFVLIVFLTPFCVFAPVLLNVKGKAAYEHGALGHAVGHQLERRWLRDPRCIQASALEVPDFSATADLFSVIGNVREIRYFPIGIHAIGELIVATFLPFVPVVLYVVPLGQLVMGVIKLFL